MARFDDAFIQRLKEETNIVTLVESYGTKLKERSGSSGEMIGLCPVHDDNEPSLVVNRKKNVWNCLGACGCGGDVIQWVMHAENASFRHAVEMLRDGTTGGKVASRHGKARKLESPVPLSGDDHELLAGVVEYYHSRLKQSPDALSYLQSRGLTDSEMIDRFQIGFVDRTLGLRLPPKQNNKAGSEVRTKLQELGILRESGHEHFRGCLTFPLLDKNGKVAQLYGRRIDEKSKSKHFYLSRPHGGIFNLPAFTASEELILCESVIDALTFWCAGLRNVTTSYGTNGFTHELHQGLIEHNIRRVLIAFDNDQAGNEAAASLTQQLITDNFEVFRVRFPAKKDANEYALAVTPATESLALAVRKAEWLGKGKAPQRNNDVVIHQNRADRGNQEATGPTSTSRASENGPVASSLAASPATPANNGSGTTQSEQSGGTAAPVTPSSSLPHEEAASVVPPVASPVPSTGKPVQAEVKDNEILLSIGNRNYRVRGLEKNLAFDVLKLNVMVRRDERFYVDTFDLYAARSRSVFVKEAAGELGFEQDVIKRDLGKVLLALEELQDRQIEEALAAKDETVELSDKDKQAALQLLKEPNLIERILSDFDACGVVGEETNKLVGYLAATSRKLDKPLAVVIQSSSAAGKSSLMEAILKLIPHEEQVNYSAMTGQSLFYMGGMELSHKILSIAEEEGVAQASYALKLLQSEGQLTIASTGKDPGTGRMETQEYHVEGPVMIFLTTTAIDIDEELLNRCVVLTVDENREQTRAIHDQQRKNETLEGLVTGQQRHRTCKLHQDAQRLLRPLKVVNPFASSLAFVDDQARRRRDHMKYLTLIRSIALLHQYQRTVKTVEVGDEVVQYIEVELSDIVLANRLADQILGRSIDELPPQTRRLLIDLHQWVQQQCTDGQLEQREYRFTRRMIREALGWSQTALKKHIERLQEMEYILSHRGSGRRVEYELLYDGRGREGQPTMCGLIDVNSLTKTTTSPGSSPLKAASSPQQQASSPQDHPQSAPSSPASGNGTPHKNKAQVP